MPENIGNLFILSAASGTGKSSLAKALVKEVTGLYLSVSHTTRQPRAGEIDGQDYYFTDEARFKYLVQQGDFLEWAKVFNHYYGTSRKQLSARLERGEDVLLEIDYQGADKVRKQCPEAISIFLLPPSLNALQERLITRGKDSLAVIKSRLSKASEEISHFSQFDYLVVNDDFNAALQALKSVTESCRLKTARQEMHLKPLLKSLINVYN